MAVRGTLYNLYKAQILTRQDLIQIAMGNAKTLKKPGARRLASWSINGKSFAFDNSTDTLDLLDEAAFALRKINGQGVTVQYASFLDA